MTDTCIRTGDERHLRGRHEADCDGGTCDGCQPCTERHCLVCRRDHTDTVCARCVGKARETLAEIVRLHGHLLTEAIHLGHKGDREGQVLGGDPMVLLAMRYADQTGARAEDKRHESFADPIPPLVTLVGWEDIWRDHLEQPTNLTATVERAAAYLDGQLHIMADELDVPFDDFVRDLRHCRARLEDTLHDGEREETGAPCPKCGLALVKVYGRNEHFDAWECPKRKCETWFLNHEYRRYVTDDYRANADRLTAPDIEAEYEVPTGTVRGWAAVRAGETEPRVRKRGKDSSGRQLYDVGDVLAMKDRKASA